VNYTQNNDLFMNVPAFKEDHISQIPALQMLINLGYQCLINQNMHNKVDRFIVQKHTIKCL
jgi:ABC-type enterochelin transport system substrate-binding protein